MKVYAKNSFDRFGDDLTEEILQYLTFEDKIRLECVSKQWQRFIYNKQFVIEILDPESNLDNFRNSKNEKTYNSSEKLRKKVKYNGTELNVKAFESVLKKCPNIKKVNVEVKANNYVFTLIGRYCTHIKSLKYRRIYPSIGEDIVLSFFRMYGHKLEELYLYESYVVTDHYLRHCTNLKILILTESSFIWNEDKEFLPKLEQFYLPCISRDNNPKKVNQLKILSDKYSKTLKRLNLKLVGLPKEELKTCIEYISRFENLKELRLEFGSMRSKEPIGDCLSLIGQKCTKLLKLDFTVRDYTIIITDRFFDSFTHFKAIKKLKILFGNSVEVKGSVKAFKDCLQLKELDIHYKKLTPDFFTNIESFVPKLQFLRIKTTQHFSDSFIDSFHSMKNIQKVILSVFTVRGFVTKEYYFGKCLSEVMLSPKEIKIKPITDNCGLTSRYDFIN